MTLSDTDKQKADIRALNDKLRHGEIAGTIVFAGSIAQAEYEEHIAAAGAVEAYEAFDSENDPHCEHDFGSFTIGEKSYFWKIDYYDLAMENLSPDPADPKVTNRVLTIFYAEDY
jgi:hypothetical protein